jgi:anti-sigma-K factor RskA
MSTVVDLSPSKGGRELSAAHARRELRRSREARTGFWRVSIVSAFFVAVLIANLFVGAVVVVGAFRKEPDTASIAIGRATIPTLDGVFCRHVLFDNRTAETKEDKISRCDDREDTKSKRRSKATFSWGGQ